MTETLIDRNLDILGGTPVFAGTRVPVRILMEHLEAGDRLDDFLTDYPTVSRSQAVALLEHATTILVSGGDDRTKIPARRMMEASGEAIVDVGNAWGLDNAFKMVARHLRPDMRRSALDRYRTLAQSAPGGTDEGGTGSTPPNNV